MKKNYKVEEVFGISRKLPLNYVERENIDKEFKDSLTRCKHVVIFGSSKQGKTCLRKKWLKEDEYISVHCSNKWELSDININILKRAGFEITQSTTKSTTGKNKILASLAAKVFGIGTEIKAEEEISESEQVTKSDLELDVEDVNDIIQALKTINFTKYILLEDFHYLKPETQRDFSIELKAMHENSNLVFIVIGVWLDENRLATYNGDLIGRLISINADKWTPKELLDVIEKGENLLKVKFNGTFKNDLISKCNESVYIVQEACYKVCNDNDVETSQEDLVDLGMGVDVDQLVEGIIAQQSGRYNSFITNFADGFQATKLEMYKWLLYPILTMDKKTLEKGLRLASIKASITEKHPKGMDLNPGNLTQSLKSIASLQVSKGITPIVIDYDETNLRLQIVDRGFLIWLSYQDRNELLSMADLPIPE